MKKLLISLSLACTVMLPLAAQAQAQASARVQYFPLVFSAEGTPTRTAGCISVAMRNTEAEAWWRPGSPAAGPGPADPALVGVLDAIKRQDRAALLGLSHRAKGRDPKRFDDQAKALFSQFPALGAPSVQYAIGFDDFTVYYLRFGARATLAPFVFELDADGAWRFLPYRTDALAFELLQDWVRSPFGPGDGAAPTLCSAAEVARLRHALPLGTGARPGAVRSRLFLNAEMPPASPRAVAAAGAFGALQKALAEEQPQAYAAGLTADGRKRFLAWHARATEAERDAPRLAMEGMRPLAAFELAPLTVLVVRGSMGRTEGRTEVVYFLGGNDAPLMVNSAHVTTLDRVFKRKDGPVLPAFRGEAGQVKQWSREP